MKVCFIIVLYNTPLSEIARLKKEIQDLNLSHYQIFTHDNSLLNKGYAHGANKGIKKGITYDADYFVFINPDVSFSEITGKKLLAGEDYFDIWGFAMKQDNIAYYGGKLDPLRMSGGLIKEKPKKRFIEREFVSGALMVAKRKVVQEIGLLREDYFLYYEDVEYCVRARRVGFKVGIDSDTIFSHEERSKGNKKKQYFLFKNRLLFLLEYGSTIQIFYELLRFPKTIMELIKSLFIKR